MSERIKSILWAKLWEWHRGRENAVSRRVLREYLQHWGITITDRKFRENYATLPICSCEDGLFIPIHRKEVLEYEKYLIKKIAPWDVREKIERIYSYFPELGPQPEPERQRKLFG